MTLLLPAAQGQVAEVFARKKGPMALILIGDIEKNIGRLLKYELESDGHVVDLVHQGGTVTAAVAMNTEHDAILLGMQTPCLDYFNKLRSIRLHNPEARIIVFTTCGASEERASLREAGADACFDKHEIGRLKVHLHQLYLRSEYRPA